MPHVIGVQDSIVGTETATLSASTVKEFVAPGVGSHRAVITSNATASVKIAVGRGSSPTSPTVPGSSATDGYGLVIEPGNHVEVYSPTQTPKITHIKIITGGTPTITVTWLVG